MAIEYIRSQINQGGLFSWASLSAKVLQTLFFPSLSLHTRELVFRNRAGIPPTRREDSRVSPPGYASSFRPQRTRRWRRRVWNHRAPYTFGPPRPAPPPPFHPSAVPFHARLLGDSRGRAFSLLISLFAPPSHSPPVFPLLSLDSFYFYFCTKHASTNATILRYYRLIVSSQYRGFNDKCNTEVSMTAEYLTRANSTIGFFTRNTTSCFVAHYTF